MSILELGDLPSQVAVISPMASQARIIYTANMLEVKLQFSACNEVRLNLGALR